MVVNADHGCNHSGILTQAQLGIGYFFRSGSTGAYDISFTEAAHQCHAWIENRLVIVMLGPRSDAMLHIIMLSDECEQSPNPGICGTQ